ncbi:MAG: pyruvate kinase, partial [Clostridia bacterium]|nr:pyruvate kinase [Clostridia bacterium]
MKKTKIVCTLGPACADEAVLEQMLKNGMNVARINFSHGTHEQHKETIERFRRVRDRLHMPAAIMLDTKGPEIRIKDFENGKVTLEAGSKFILTADDVIGNEDRVSITYGALCKQVEPGNKILADDGKIEFEVDSCTDNEIVCTVLAGGVLSNKKSINVPYVHLDMEYLSEADKADIIFGIENDVDFIAASFVRSKEDVIALRKFINYHGGRNICIISKIENTEGIDNFDEILEHSDGIMVARGDLGVEVDYERLPGIQKKFIKKCYQSGKMIITATQMLESMINSPTPTRAEITDVANAVFDGTSAIMLSGETAVGKYSAKTVQVMAKIAEQAERDAFEMGAYKGMWHDNDVTDTTNAICDATCTTACDLNASAIIAVTKSGYTARRMSKFRPEKPIIATTPVLKTYHQLSLSWGVYPVLALNQDNTDELFMHAIECAKMIDMVSEGDRVVITAGVPLGVTGTT